MVLQRLAIGICRNQRRYINIKNNPYKVKRPWPPDYTKLPQSYQLRLERRYRRRSKLKWARPRFIKGVNVFQFVAITFVIVYAVLFMESAQPRGENPFKPIRQWFFGKIDSFWSHNSAESKSPTEKAQKD